MIFPEPADGFSLFPKSRAENCAVAPSETHHCTTILSADFSGLLQLKFTFFAPQEPFHRPINEMLDVSVNKDKLYPGHCFFSLSRRSAGEAADLFPHIPYLQHRPHLLFLSFFLPSASFASHASSFLSLPLPSHPPTSFSRPFFSPGLFDVILFCTINTQRC